MPGVSLRNNTLSFESFLEDWLLRQRQVLDQLSVAQQNFSDVHDGAAIRDLVNRVFSHYEEYYEEKSRIAHRNVFVVFSPPWFTRFERSFLWIAGFKPGLAFNLVENAVVDLTGEQSGRMERLKQATQTNEEELAEELAKIQESVAAPPFAALAMREGGVGPMDGEIREVDDVIEVLKAAMEAVLTNADRLRTRTVEEVVEILRPVQKLRFLAAATQLQLRIREIGKQREVEDATNGW